MLNRELFSVYEKAFLLYREMHGEASALAFLRRLFERVLTPLYQDLRFERGNPMDFARVVGARDAEVGLKVSFPEVGPERIVYHMETDAYPQLRGLIEAEAIDDVSMHFKVKFVLGDRWIYRVNKHIWDGADKTEYIIVRRDASEKPGLTDDNDTDVSSLSSRTRAKGISLQ